MQRLAAIDAILMETLAALERAPRDRESPYRWPALATAGPAARTVVLREVRREPLELSVFSDARTPKVEQLRRDPRAELLFFDRAAMRQIRVAGQVSLHRGDPTAARAWRDTHQAREDYARIMAPGSLAQDPLAAGETEGDGSENFMVLRLRPEILDWLDLAREGHRRLRFRRQAAGWTGDWVVP